MTKQKERIIIFKCTSCEEKDYVKYPPLVPLKIEINLRNSNHRKKLWNWLKAHDEQGMYQSKRLNKTK